MDDLRGALGHRIRHLRERLGLSQEELAERANLHWTYVSGLERGRRNPGLSTLVRLASALETTLPALVTNLRAHVRVTVRVGRPPKTRRSAR